MVYESVWKNKTSLLAAWATWFKGMSDTCGAPSTMGADRAAIAGFVNMTAGIEASSAIESFSESFLAACFESAEVYNNIDIRFMGR